MIAGLDARFLTHPQQGGFKTYTTSLIGGFAALDGPEKFVLFVDREGAAYAHLDRQRFDIRVLKGDAGALGMPLREQVLLPRAMARSGASLLHSMCNTSPLLGRMPLVATLHDALWREAKPAARRGARTLRQRLMDDYTAMAAMHAARHARLIITVSAYARGEIVARCGIPADRVRVVHNAPGRIFQEQRDRAQCARRVAEKYGITGPYILGLGASDPRKNIVGLVRAYALLPEALRAATKLVVVWADAAMSAAMQNESAKLGLKDPMTSLVRLNHDALADLYRAASVFAFPSHAEGFGLPVLEAMSSATPVVASNTTSIPEVAGDAALLVDPDATAEWAQALTRVLTDADLRGRLADAGPRRAARFTWEQSARETLAVYREALASGARVRIAA